MSDKTKVEEVIDEVRECMKTDGDKLCWNCHANIGQDAVIGNPNYEMIENPTICELIKIILNAYE